MIDRTLNYGRHHIERFLRDAQGTVVLDLGAGLGADLLLARKVKPDAVLHALEVYPEYQRELEKKGICVHAANLEADALPFPDQSVDVIIANQILEHVKEVFWIFHEASRTLAVGGSFIIGVPNLASFHNRMLLLFGMQPTIITNSSAHVRGWSKRDMIRFVESIFPGGYELKGFGGGNFYPLPGAIAKPMATLLPNMAWSVFMRFEKKRAYAGEFLRWPAERRLETNFYTGPA